MSDTPATFREASLLWAHQRLYPGVQAGVWYIAASLASALGVGREPARRDADRVLSDQHFEFRGGDASELRPRDARTRCEDGPASRSDASARDPHEPNLPA